ncbi:MAG: class I mannose-6-phosphate isomerase [Oscillospiraceae bacterium]|jgi:mannose-6-phosphate isomerase|nr:class I mannose-6-phosphate isomerase [Oscillospiraceae bacterium]
MHPLKLIPACKDYIWGGTRLKTEYNKISGAATIAESWELSCHRDGLSVISEGEYAGASLLDYINDNKNALGTACERFGRFPVLIKLIDAADDLSIQVHPNDEQAAKDGDWGKTEMWYVVDAAPGSELIYGFNRRLSRGEFARRIENGTLTEVVNRVRVKKGDIFFIPAGTLHAIGKGILIAEIQQNSNLTYRVYDYGRKGADGKPRELHIKKALDVTELGPPGAPRGRTRCEYFRAAVADIEGELSLRAEASFVALLALEGEANVGGVSLKKGETCFIPALYGDFTVAGKLKALIADVVSG